NIGIPLTTRLHDYLEHEIEFAAKLFINQNKIFVEFLINNLNLFCENITVINKPPGASYENYHPYWKDTPEFLNKYMEG
ncbi:hypothetical protein KC669_04380, partial [Candidatus Dojkabacteria bacterium]|nr:hypothetical protein [Candidatus Dojkabacteria bacterium]